jgi:hypothetical protein
VTALPTTGPLELVDLDVDDPRWSAVLPVLQDLRPGLTLARLQEVHAEGRATGYRFTAAFDRTPGAPDTCLGVAGWRVVATLVAGRKL